MDLPLVLYTAGPGTIEQSSWKNQQNKFHLRPITNRPYALLRQLLKNENSPPSLVCTKLFPSYSMCVLHAHGYSFHFCFCGILFVIKFASLYFESEAWW